MFRALPHAFDQRPYPEHDTLWHSLPPIGARAHDETPMLLMSGVSGAPEAVTAFRAGALDFLIKPIDEKVLESALAKALAESAERQRRRLRQSDVAARFAYLSGREREVIQRVARGQRNREIAEALGIALRTVKQHRHQAMEKLQVATLVDLVHLIDEAIEIQLAALQSSAHGRPSCPPHESTGSAASRDSGTSVSSAPISAPANQSTPAPPDG